MRPLTWARITRTIWRINGIALFILLMIGLSVAASSLMSGLFSARTTARSEDAQQVLKESGQPELRLGPFQPVEHASILRAELRESGGDSFSLKGGSGQVHNVLFVDAQLAKSWWLLPDSEGVIVADQTVAEPGRGMDNPLAKVLCVSRDDDATRSLLLVDLKGTRSLILAQGEVTLDEVVPVSSKEARVLWHDAKGYRISVVNPLDLTRLGEMPCPVQFQARTRK